MRARNREASGGLEMGRRKIADRRRYNSDIDHRNSALKQSRSDRLPDAFGARTNVAAERHFGPFDPARADEVCRDRFSDEPHSLIGEIPVRNAADVILPENLWIHLFRILYRVKRESQKSL